MKIAVIIVLYKTPKKQVERLKQVFLANFPTCHLFIIDNTGKKNGYAQGVNDGFRQSKEFQPDIYIIANPDISLPHIDQEIYLTGLKHFDILGFVTKQDGKKYYGGHIDYWNLSGGLIEKVPANRFTKVDFVSGSLMIIKKDVIKKVGPFSQGYFMYYEDVDYCVRAKKNDFKVGIDRDIEYEHCEVSKTNPAKQLYLQSAHELFFKKYSHVLQRLYRRLKSYENHR